ncbi:hypothetical protein BO99DRAFT_446138 [Aspergillus violaceofuscus CBS 115571]|uniref:Uncharacterized protein n=1 Tax=Aspergillus violaceofuscus (strain CBS 115571) TaxID=1450538 RepID=A0A2V5GVS0_ASPV1|nr:hypothetical protein BO99DRAFT_446138 [Aspergillus violaceofuscus CBS 115571]
MHRARADTTPDRPDTSWPLGPALLPTCGEHGDPDTSTVVDIRLREGRARRHYLATERPWDSAHAIAPGDVLGFLSLHQGGGNSPVNGFTVEILEDLPVRLEDEMEGLVKEAPALLDNVEDRAVKSLLTVSSHSYTTASIQRLDTTRFATREEPNQAGHDTQTPNHDEVELPHSAMVLCLLAPSFASDVTAATPADSVSDAIEMSTFHTTHEPGTAAAMTGAATMRKQPNSQAQGYRLRSTGGMSRPWGPVGFGAWYAHERVGPGKEEAYLESLEFDLSLQSGYSRSYHPETDGQSAHTIQHLENYTRALTEYMYGPVSSDAPDDRGNLPLVTPRPVFQATPGFRFILVACSTDMSPNDWLPWAGRTLYLDDSDDEPARSPRAFPHGCAFSRSLCVAVPPSWVSH